MTRATVLLTDRVTADAVAALASVSGWELRSDVARAHFVPACLSWQSSPGTTVDYVEDHTSDIRFLRTSGPNAATVMAQIGAALPCADEDEIFEATRNASDPIAWIRGLSRLAAVRPNPPTDRETTLWERALEHDHPAVRRAAIRTAYGGVWPALAKIVRRRLGEDPELSGPLGHLAAYFDRVDEAATTG